MLATCPKCRSQLPPSLAEVEDTADDRARVCANHGCRYVACDSLRCLALKEPNTREEWREAAEHWKNHHLMSGCSHGR